MYIGANLMRGSFVMVNFVCQLGRCFWMRLIFKLMKLE